MHVVGEHKRHASLGSAVALLPDSVTPEDYDIDKQVCDVKQASCCRFFDITSAGRVLNRFSSDTATVDDALPFIMNILFANMFGLAGKLLPSS